MSLKVNSSGSWQHTLVHTRWELTVLGFTRRTQHRAQGEVVYIRAEDEGDDCAHHAGCRTGQAKAAGEPGYRLD